MRQCTWCGRLSQGMWYHGRYLAFCKPSHQWEYEDTNIFQKLWLWLKNG